QAPRSSLERYDAPARPPNSPNCGRSFMLLAALIWVLTGALAGWLAGNLMKGRDYGLGGNLILRLLGSVVGAWLLHLLGEAPPQDTLRQVITSSLGALLVLGIARRLRPVARQTRATLVSVGVADLET